MTYRPPESCGVTTAVQYNIYMSLKRSFTPSLTRLIYQPVHYRGCRCTLWHVEPSPVTDLFDELSNSFNHFRIRFQKMFECHTLHRPLLCVTQFNSPIQLTSTGIKSYPNSECGSSSLPLLSFSREVSLISVEPRIPIWLHLCLPSVISKQMTWMPPGLLQSANTSELTVLRITKWGVQAAFSLSNTSWLQDIAS